MSYVGPCALHPGMCRSGTLKLPHSIALALLTISARSRADTEAMVSPLCGPALHQCTDSNGAPAKRRSSLYSFNTLHAASL